MGWEKGKGRMDGRRTGKVGWEKEGQGGVGKGRAGWGGKRKGKVGGKRKGKVWWEKEGQGGGGRGAEKMVVGLWAKLKAVGLDRYVSRATWSMCF